MNRKILKNRGVKVLAVSVAVGALLGGSTAMAAEEYHPAAITSYGTWIFDDGKTSNNNGKAHDIYIDAGDIVKVNNNVNIVHKTVEAIEISISNIEQQIENIEQQITNINEITNNANVKVDHWDEATQSLYLVPIE